MSFILDALKKSEERRQQGDSSRTVRTHVLSASSKTFTRWPLLILFLVPLALAGGWWLRGVPEVSSLPEESSPEVIVEKAPETVAEIQASEPVVVPVMPTAVETIASQNPVIEEPVAVVEVLMPKVPPVTVNPEPPQQNARPSYRELSTPLRDRLPPLDMSMHFFTEDPKRRLVRINGRLLHEGDWVNDDLLIDEIVSTGVVLDFAGVPFELRSPAN